MDQRISDGEAMAPTNMSSPSRNNAKNELRAAIKRHTDAAKHLQALLDELPGKLSPEADDALWHLALREGR